MVWVDELVDEDNHAEAGGAVEMMVRPGMLHLINPTECSTLCLGVSVEGVGTGPSVTGYVVTVLLCANFLVDGA